MPASVADNARSERGFWALVALQFQGALSDNLLKQIVLLGMIASQGYSEGRQGILNSVVGFVFLFPSLLLSAWAGMFADKCSKRRIAIWTKVWELGVMLLALAAMRMQSLTFAIIVLFTLGSQFALFSPSKYGIIPELVRRERVTWANGIIELTTFLAIIFGMFAGTGLISWFTPDGMDKIVWILIALAGLGLLCGQFISRTPPVNPGRTIRKNFLPEMMRSLRVINADRRLKWSVIGLAYFWAYGAVLLAHVNVWGEHTLGMQALGGLTKIDGAWVRSGREWWNLGAGGLVVFLAFGIGIGSALAGHLSRDRVELGLVGIGGIGMAVFLLPLCFATRSNMYVMLASLFAVSLSAGLYSVPLNAMLQLYARDEERGALIGASNIVINSAMLLAMTAYGIFNAVKQPLADFANGLLHVNFFHPNANSIYYVLVVLTAIGTYVILRLLPQAMLQFISFMTVHFLYRLRVTGRENIPKEGPALLVANHTSFVDALLLMAVSPRPIRFIVYEDIYNKPRLRRLMRTMRAIPISEKQSPKALLHSLNAAGGALDAGELVCIFAEGQITRTGLLLPFQRGYKFILKNHPAPVIPIYLEGVWGSIFSFENGKFFWKWPRQIPYPVRIAIGAALPPEVEPIDLRMTMQDLGAEAAIASRATLAPAHHTAIRTARRRWFRPAMLDGDTPQLGAGEVIWRSIILARRLAPAWKSSRAVGILLPPSVGGALVNVAAALSGRTTVNLNYTVGAEVLRHCCEESEITTVVTTRPFLEKLKIEPPVQAIYIEDYKGYRGWLEAAGAVLAALFLPPRLIEKYCHAVSRPDADSLLTIIFSSGSTGTPKGVMLTHGNICANIQSLRHSVTFLRDDRMLGVLPFFHSFGYMATLWTPLQAGFSMVYHFSPIDCRAIGDLCEKHGVNIIIATPTFLQFYLRKIEPTQFGALRFVITGAEKLPASLREAFAEKFGVEAYEGYGSTECSPLVSINVPHFRAAGMFQAGHKRGAIGHPAPGVAVRVVHPETGVAMPPGEAGLLLVKGPNVMRGYLKQPEKTAAVLREGWYDTGDVAYIDEDGFIFITDRLARFSKIGGEMVPHVTVQDKLQELSGAAEPSFVVTASPDAGKGEKLVVLHTLEDSRIDELHKKMLGAGLPNLFIPRRDMYFHVEGFPVLGTGKLDLAGVKSIARERAGGGED